MKNNKNTWQEVTLGEVINFFDYQRIPLSTAQRKERQGDFPYYGASGIIDYINDYIFDGKYLLVSEDGENLKTRKTPIAFLASGKFWVNNHAHIIRGKEKIADDYFLMSLLEGINILGYLTGTAQPKLSQANLKAIRFNLPPLSAQQKIAGILSAYDDLIENNTRRIEILEEMARMLYREWFVKFRFPGHEAVQFVESELGLIPENWEVVKIENFGKVITGKTPSKTKPEYYGSYMPFIKTPSMHGKMFCIEVEEYLSKEGADSQRHKILPPNTLIVNCIGALAGSVSITSEFSQTNQQINAVILNNIKNREFLYFLLVELKETIRQYGSTGATMINLSKGKFESLSVLSPNRIILNQFNRNRSEEV
jgi:type I restriction enzyme, S subunit